MSIVSFNEILVNRLQMSYEIINFIEVITSCISLQNEKESFVQYSVGITRFSISVKGCLLSGLKSFVVYKFVWAGCQCCSIGETKRHLLTRINENLVTDKKYHIFKQLFENSACKNLCEENFFASIDSASSFFRIN